MESAGTGGFYSRLLTTIPTRCPIRALVGRVFFWEREDLPADEQRGPGREDAPAANEQGRGQDQRPAGQPPVLHLAGMPWARMGELVGHDDLVTTARTYTHVVADEAELNYAALLRAAGGGGGS